MIPPKLQILIDTVHTLLKRGVERNVKNLLSQTHPADIAFLLQHLEEGEQEKVFQLIEDPAHQAEVCSELEIKDLAPLLDTLDTVHLREIFHHMPSDDAADILAVLPEELSGRILTAMKEAASKEVEALLQYGEETAGGIMTPKVFTAEETKSVKEVIEALHRAEAIEMVYYAYVVDLENHLVGVASLRNLLTTKPYHTVGEIMATDVISVSVDTDQEEVARLVARYNLLAIPVVDKERRIVGQITVDDIIDVLHEEATEDILRMGGAGEADVLEKSSFSNVRARFPWLLASMIGGLIAAQVINSFSATLSKVALLAAFIPIVIGMSGNVGTQSAAIMIRGLATGKVRMGEIGHILFKEGCVGALLGILYGVILLAVIRVQFNAGTIAMIVGLSIAANMLFSAFVGTLVPLVFARLGFDPALSTGPFVTTSLDICGTVIYFSLASLFLHLV